MVLYEESCGNREDKGDKDLSGKGKPLLFIVLLFMKIFSSLYYERAV